MDQAPAPSAAEEAERARIVEALSKTGFCLPGSLSIETTRCGKPNCACKAEPPVLHGPYHHWTRKVAGKTVGRYLSTDQIQRYQGWFDQARRLRDLLAQLETLSLRIAERAEGWEPQAAPTGHRRRTGTRPSATGRRRGQEGR